MNDDAITTFRIDVHGPDLADLAARLDRTRWPNDSPTDHWRYGVALKRARELRHHPHLPPWAGDG